MFSSPESRDDAGQINQVTTMLVGACSPELLRKKITVLTHSLF
jgi:hypothetical protein